MDLKERRKELQDLASKRFPGGKASVKVEGDDDVACIGLLARLLGIDALAALNVTAPLP